MTAPLSHFCGEGRHTRRSILIQTQRCQTEWVQRQEFNTSMLQISFVCTGNICRSPMAAVVMQGLIDEAGLHKQIVVDSSGTGGWHIGHPADPRTLSTLEAHGLDGQSHRARQFAADWAEAYDLILALDHSHESELKRTVESVHRSKIQLLRSFDPHACSIDDLDVPDPYYDGLEAFENCYHQVKSACKYLLEHLQAQLEIKRSTQ